MCNQPNIARARNGTGLGAEGAWAHILSTDTELPVDAFKLGHLYNEGWMVTALLCPGARTGT